MPVPAECDLSDEAALSAAFDEALARGSTLIADLSHTTFIDSVIIGLLVTVHERCRASRSHRLVVVAPPALHPRRIIDMTCGGVLEVKDTMPAALAAANST